MTDEQITDLWLEYTWQGNTAVVKFARALLSASIADTAGTITNAQRETVRISAGFSTADSTPREFYLMLYREKMRRGLEWKDVAKESDVGSVPLTRLAMGRSLDLLTTDKLMHWLATPPAPSVAENKP